MIMVRQGPIGLLAVLVTVICLLVYLGTTAKNAYSLPSGVSGAFSSSRGGAQGASNPAAKVYGKDYRGRSKPADINRVTNSTLGFTKIFVVGLPERSDKRDAIALSAALTGFDVEWIDGVRGTDIPDKAVPFGVDRKKLMETNLGSWRGHMNAVRRMVEEGIESALIMEDDMDWDVRLKAQLEMIATGSRKLMTDLPETYFPSHPKTAGSGTPASPYGNDWDVLWLGHCGEPFPEDLDENKGLAEDDPARLAMQRKYTISNDPSVPPRAQVKGLADFAAHPERTRFVHHTAAPICTFAYALSQRGAQKVLFDLSVDRLAGPFDNALAGLCRRAVGAWPELARRRAASAAAPGSGSGPAEKKLWSEEELRGITTDRGDRGLDAKCLSVTPPVFFHHKKKGLLSGDSDIQTVGDGGIREKGTTENIVWSARNNLRNMMLGLPMESQY
ncbi:uncharacterized protein E0L32_009194 [Thyridium curvatum]|uniref:Glycosyltransferase family 25 protein n=1 Tax=Thyridium curvatum TaxID=1093900 RepID=A0A507APA9_9PEZI|nr:uncharacterized protein E0L32_009194 [Thyridium curvatum]TPX09593.1 hypothetical protein E0L32_009194 [Thyridium curvatum]